MRIGICLLIYIVIFSGCGNNRENSKTETGGSLNLSDITEDSVKRIIIPNEIDSQYFYSQFIDSVSYIKLETTPKSRISYIKKIEIFKDAIYVLDMKGKSLLKFGIDGKFMTRIGHVGKGAGEYRTPLSFSIDTINSEILILDDRGRKILYYDLSGNFKNEVQLKFKLSDFEILNGRKYVANTDGRQHERDLEKYKLIIADKDWQILERHLQYDMGKDILASIGETMSRYKNTILYNPVYSNSVYEVKDNSVGLKYVFDVGKREPAFALDEKLSELEFQNKYDNPKSEYMFVNQAVYETEDFIATAVTYKTGNLRIYYSKKSGKVIIGKSYKNDIHYFGIVYVMGVNNNNFIGVIDPSVISSYKEGWKKYSLAEQIPKKLQQLAYSIKEGDNPIISIIKMKVF